MAQMGLMKHAILILSLLIGTAGAAQQLRPRLDEAGWELLNVVSTFDEAGLAEREDSAGENYLRY